MAAKKTTAKAEPKQVELNPKEVYKIKVIKDSKHLKKGDEYSVSGDVANQLLGKKLIELV